MANPNTPDPSESDLDIARAFASENEEHDTRTGDPAVSAPTSTEIGDTEVAGGDPDASVTDADSVGEEAPGMGNPTPDQDIVDDLGEAAGVVFRDTEPLDFERKIVRRDEERWELNPASAEDFGEHPADVIKTPEPEPDDDEAEVEQEE